MDHDDMDTFAAEARSFLDAYAAKAPDRTAFTWGEGDDSMAYFSSLPPEEEREHVRRAREWQRIRHENGFGWITGPPEYGGRGLTPVHDLLYDAVESAYDVPDTGVLGVIGLGMIGPTILA
ncbi:acyl-CoA dehydrogenase, partial [Streptomyces sp. WM6386]